MGSKQPEANRCVQEPGKFEPVIDPSKCEAKGPCVPACPYDVLEIRPLTRDDKDALSFFGRFKAMVHGNKRAFAAKPDDCRACGYCVAVCPEDAITLRLKGRVPASSG
jgi:4Fe-4S ferredoxin